MKGQSYSPEKLAQQISNHFLVASIPSHSNFFMRLFIMASLREVSFFLRLVVISTAPFVFID